jgi:hypothetical protein
MSITITADSPFVLADDEHYTPDGILLTLLPPPVETVHPTAFHLWQRLGTKMIEHDPELGYPLLFFLHCITQGLAHVDDLVRDTDEGPGWQIVFDIDRIDNFRLLRWLGQFIGVQEIRSDAGIDAARDLLRYPAAHFMRGTKEYMIERVRATLAGSKRLQVRERTGSAYRMEVRVAREDCPDPGLSRLAAMKAKPGGLLLDLILAEFNTYGEQRQSFAIYTELRETFVNYEDAKSWSIGGEDL